MTSARLYLAADTLVSVRLRVPVSVIIPLASVPTAKPDASGVITETGTLNLTDTGVSAARYNRADVTVDAQGRITAAEAGIGDVNFNTQGTNAIRFVNDRLSS